MDHFETSGSFYDGETANATPVPVRISAEGVSFEIEGIWISWPMSDLRCLQDQARDSGMILEREDATQARLIISDRAATTYLWSWPNKLTKRKTTNAMKKRVAVWGTAAFASVGLIIFVVVPAMSNTLARYIPIEREIALGEYAMRQIEWVISGDREKKLTCNGENGQLALEKMAKRLKDNFETAYPLNVRVFRQEMVNAFAVPGGQIVLFEGLIKAAKSPEEIAGVLGHEFGHTVNRDPTRLSMRSAGSAGLLGLVFGDFAGGFATLALAEALMSANYSQEAETNADVFSHEIFARAELPAARFANFFEYLMAETDTDGSLMAPLASHPNLQGRADAARAADVVGDGSFTPVLTSLEWAALQGICKDG